MPLGTLFALGLTKLRSNNINRASGERDKRRARRIGTSLALGTISFSGHSREPDDSEGHLARDGTRPIEISPTVAGCDAPIRSRLTRPLNAARIG